jgi:subtilisin-like proprotein convertase family protein
VIWNVARGLGGLVVLLALLGGMLHTGPDSPAPHALAQGPAQPQAVATFNGGPVTIPNSGSGSPYPSTINVTGMTGLVTKVTATLSGLSHTFPDDIDILLVGPGGQSVVLMSDTGTSLDVSGVTLTFDDAAAAGLPDSAQIVSGTFRPTNIGAGDTFPGPAPAAPYGAALTAFNGTNPNGIWSLYIFDDLGGDTGSLAGWSVTITTGATGTRRGPRNR